MSGRKPASGAAKGAGATTGAGAALGRGIPTVTFDGSVFDAPPAARSVGGRDSTSTSKWAKPGARGSPAAAASRPAQRPRPPAVLLDKGDGERGGGLRCGGGAHFP